ncbi:MAG: Nramp family divalent metal transporter [Gemmatimonadota bacterium]
MPVDGGPPATAPLASAAAALEPLERLELPSLAPWALAREFGPGVILMMTGIGTSHLVTAPAAGGRFGYALLWCIPVAYIFKYYGFEMAFRFTNATGKSLLAAYATAPRKWPLWYVMITTLLQCAVGQAGRLIAAAAVLYYFFTQYLGLPLRIEAYALILGLVSVGVILRGRYQAVELAAKLLAAVLVVSTVAVFVVRPAPLVEMRHFFLVEVPGGSWLVIAAFLGLLPTGIDVSLQASEWGTAKRTGMSRVRPHLEEAGLVSRFDPFSSPGEHLTVDVSRLPSHARDYCRRWFRIGLWDFRWGHLVSFVLATVFLVLAAVWLHPSAIEGREVMGEIAGIFTLSVGPWMMVVFLLGALAATFSTAFNYFDGWPRIVAACCRNLFRPTARLRGIGDEGHVGDEYRRKWYSEYNLYRVTMVYSLVASVLLVAGVPRPVYLVLVASALAFFIAPVIFFLNLYYCLTLIPKNDRAFYPSRFARWFGWGSLTIFTGMSVILILARVFRVSLFGG